MKTFSYFQTLSLLKCLMLVAFLSLTSTSFFSTYACNPSPCTLPPGTPPCGNSVAVVKAFPVVVPYPPVPITITVPITVNTKTGTQVPCGGTCTMPATVTGGTVTATFTGPGGPFTGSAPMPALAAPGFNNVVVSVPVNIPAATAGIFTLVGSATVNFSATPQSPAQTLLGTGDMVVCFVEPSPADPTIPRLDMQFLGDASLNCEGGSPQLFEYLVTNNDPTESVTLEVTATSQQEARMPTVVSGDPNYAYSISTPIVGDDFPIVFQENLKLCVPDPADKATFDQSPIHQEIVIGPGQSHTIRVATRSYHACADGSCNQYTCVVEGFFDGGDPALACVSNNLTVNSAMDCTPEEPLCLNFDGSNHQSQGATSIHENTDGHLVVSNIGSSGQDGVEIDLGQSQAAIVDLDPNTLPNGSSFNMLTFGQVAGNPAPDVITQIDYFKFDPNLGQYLVSYPNFGFVQGFIEVFQGDAPVFGGQFEEVAFFNIQGGACDRINPYSQLPGEQPVTTINFPISVFIEIDDFGYPVTVMGDRVVITPFLPPATAVDFISGMVITGNGIPVLNIFHEELVMWNFAHSVLGDATFCTLGAPGGHLVVSNIGSSGEDGVSIDLGETASFNMSFEQIPEPNASGLLPSFQVGASGTVGGTPDQDLGFIEMQATPDGFYDMMTDYSASGTTTKRIEIYDNGNLIYVNEGYPNDFIATVPTLPTGCAKGLPPGGLYCYILPFPFGTPFLIGTNVVIGDEIRVQAENTTAPIDFISEFHFTGANLNEVVINDENLDDPISGTGGLMDCADLFLDPTGIPLSAYPVMTLGVGGEVTFQNPAFQVVDFRIIPPIHTNPADDLVCDVDYFAALYSGVVTVEFLTEAPYFIQTTWADGTVESLIVEVSTNGTLGIGGGICNSGVATQIDCGNPDVALVSSTLGFDHTWGATGTEVTNISTAAQAVCDAYTANGNMPVSVTINAHGSSGSIEIGGEVLDINNLSDFTNAVQGKISSLNIFSCSVAEGAAGWAFICALEAALGVNVVASTGTMWDTVSNPPRWYTAGVMTSWEPEPPSLEWIEPPFAYPGQAVQLGGTDFGSPSPDAFINIDGIPYPYQDLVSIWTPELIVFEMPCVFDPGSEPFLPPLFISPSIGVESNSQNIQYLTPSEVTFISPIAGSTISTPSVHIQAVPEGESDYIVQADFEYRTDPLSPWIHIDTDFDGTDEAIGTVIPIGEGDGWSTDFIVDSFFDVALDIRVTFTDLCGNTFSDFEQILIDPTPLAGDINKLGSKLNGSKIIDGDKIKIEIDVEDEDAIELLINFHPFTWVWERDLEQMQQLGAGLKNKAGENVDTMACGPVAVASCLRYFKDKFPKIDSIAIDSLAQILVCHSGTNNEQGTTVGNLLRGIRQALTGAGIDLTDWQIEWVDATGSEDEILDKMAKCAMVDKADVIPLFRQDANKDLNGDGDTTKADGWGHFVTMSSFHTTFIDSVTATGNRVLKVTKTLDFMDPWTGTTEYHEIDETTSPPSLDYPLGPDGCTAGKTYIRGFLKVLPPCPDGEKLANPLVVNSHLQKSGAATMPLSGPDTYTYEVNSTDLELGATVVELITIDAAGNSASTQVVVTVGGCSDTEFTADVTTGEAPLNVNFTDQTTYTETATGWLWDFNNDGTIDDMTQSPSYTFDAVGTYDVVLYAQTEHCTDAAYKAQFIVVEATAAPTVLQAKIFLEGPYLGSGLMATTLLENNLIPLTQPYNRTPWNYNGAETVTTIPANVTDWILVEIRDTSPDCNLITQQAAFLRNDGMLIDVDGSVGVLIDGLVPATDYNVLIRHRNHLAVLSADAINIPTAIAYDFTTAQGQALGGNQLADLGDGSWGMYAGDFDSNGVITVADFNFYQTEVSQINVYADGDGNLDRAVTVADFNKYQPNASVIGIAKVRY